MPEQLIFTSAPRGLKAGSGGYCTVAQSRNLRDGLILPLEQLSYYSHLSLPGQEALAKNPIICVYRKLTLTGTEYRILTRIVDAGADHTGRSNYLAHHLVFENDWRNAPSPAVIFKAWQGWHNSWSHPAGYIEEDPTDGLKGLNSGKSYSPEFLEYGWQHTFTSFLQAKDAQSQFDWIGVRNDPNTCGDILREAHQPLIQLQGPAELQGDWLLTFKNPGRNGIEAPDNDENKLIDLYEHTQQQAICHAQDAAFTKANQKIDEAEKNLNYQYQIIKQVHQSVTNAIADFNTEHDHLTDEGGRKARLNQNTKSDLKAPLEKATIGYKNAEALSCQTSSKVAEAKTRLAKLELIELDLSQEIQQLKAFNNILNDQKSIIDKIISDFLSELEAMKPIKPVLAKRTPYQAPQTSVENIYIPKQNPMSQVASHPDWQHEEAPSNKSNKPQTRGLKVFVILFSILGLLIIAALITGIYLKANPNIMVLEGNKNELLVRAKLPEDSRIYCKIIDSDDRYKTEPMVSARNLFDYYKKEANTNSVHLVGLKKIPAFTDTDGNEKPPVYTIYLNNAQSDAADEEEYWKIWWDKLDAVNFDKRNKEEILNILICCRVQYEFNELRNSLLATTNINDFIGHLDTWDEIIKEEAEPAKGVNGNSKELIADLLKEITGEFKGLEKTAAENVIATNFNNFTNKINNVEGDVQASDTRLKEIRKEYDLSIRALKSYNSSYSNFVHKLVISETGEYNIKKSISEKTKSINEEEKKRRDEKKKQAIDDKRTELENALTKYYQKRINDTLEDLKRHDLSYKNFDTQFLQNYLAHTDPKNLGNGAGGFPGREGIYGWLKIYNNVDDYPNNKQKEIRNYQFILNSISSTFRGKDQDTETFQIAKDYIAFKKQNFKHLRGRGSPRAVTASLKATISVTFHFINRQKLQSEFVYSAVIKDLKVK